MPDHWTTAVSSNGWTDRFLALQWLERNFEPSTRPAEGDDDYRLLIYDGHDSHITYEFIEYAYAHRNKCLCLPAHSTHLLQPLDIVTFSRYAAEYSKALDNASRHGITGVDKELFMQLFQEARKGVFTNRLRRSAFRSTGIYPYNPDAVLKNLPELNADSEYYQHPIPRLKKDKVKRGYAHYGKAENLGVWTTVMARTNDEWTFVHISFLLDNSSDQDLDAIVA